MEAWRALALGALLTLAALPIGAAALRLAGIRRAECASNLESVLLCVAGGWGAIAFGLTLVGLARMLYAALVIAAPLVTALLALPLGRAFWRSVRTRPMKRRWRDRVR